MDKLKLMLEAHGIDPAILKDPMLRMLIDEGDGVDAMRYLQRKTGVTLSTREQLTAVSMLEDYQHVDPNPEILLDNLGVLKGA